MKGFTLIETVAYMGLLSMIFVIILPTYYFISDSITRQKLHLVEFEERKFILKKLEMLVSSSVAIVEPNTGQSGETLRLSIPESGEVTVGLSEGAIYIENSPNSSREYLTSKWVNISELNFKNNEQDEYSMSSVSFSFKINTNSVPISTPTSTIEISKRTF